MGDLSYFHGAKVVESAETPSLLRVSNFGVTFFNGTAPLADPAQFPFGVPTRLASLAAAASLGAGWLKDSVEAYFGEGGSVCIVNRVEVGVDAAATQTNLIGDATARTGIYAALRCKSLLGTKPRLIVTEGDTGAWIDDGLVSVSIVAQGSNLTEAPAVVFTDGGADPGKVLPTAVAVLGTGVDAGRVVGITVTSAGRNMSAAPVVTFTGGGAAVGKVLPSATANIGDVANPYISALNAVTPSIRARAYIAGPNTSNAEAVRFRNTINSDRILVIDPKAIKNVNGVPVIKPMVPAFAGVRARVVASSEGVSGSVSNKPLRTIDGVARTIDYGADANYLNENSVNTVINERGGFRTWGSRLATSQSAWAFDSVRATADMINEALEDIYFEWVDRKFTKANLKMMVEDGNAAVKVFALNDDIIGGRVWLSELNEPTLNASGKVFLDVEFEPVGIMEQITITTHRNIVYYRLLLDSVRGAIENGPLTLAA